MGHYDDQTVSDLVARVKPILKGLGDDDLFDKGQRYVEKLVGDFEELDPGHLPEGPKAEGWRSQRDEAAAWLEALLDQVPEPELPVGPIVTKKTYTDRRGRITTDELDAAGHLVNRTQATREESEAAQAEVRAVIDAREEVKDLRARAIVRRQLAHDVGGSGSSASELLEKEAREMDETASTKFEALRSSVPPEQWGSYGLGEPNILGTAVQSGVDAVKANKLDDALIAFGKMSSPQRLEFAEQVGSEAFDELLLQDARNKGSE